MDESFCFFFQKEGLFFFEKKNQKTFFHWMGASMAPRVDLVQSDTGLPHRTSVVVIGGGVAGISTALFRGG